MKLFFLINDKPGGAEQVLKQLVKFYLDRNEYVMICFFLSKSSDFWDDLTSNTNLKTVYFDKSIWKFFRLIKIYNKNIDYIFTTHVYVTGFIGLLIKLKIVKKNKFIGRESTLIFDRFFGLKKFTYKCAYYFGYSSVDLLICQTELMKFKLLKALPVLNNREMKVEVIPNPFNRSNINFLDFNWNDDSVFSNSIVSAGRLISEKGFDVLIDAFIKLTEVYPAYKLIILGEGKERKTLENKINSLGLENKVLLTGHIPNVFPYFKKAKLCVVSSRIEGFPNVLLQMMSQNVNVVSTKCAGGIDEIQGVYIAETDNAESLYNAIVRCLNDNNEENRMIFDVFLNERSIDNFISKMEKELK